MDSETRFSFVECASQAYRFMWDRRVDIARLSAPMIAFKILVFVGFAVFKLSDNHLREGLYQLPVYFFEGWVIAQIMVMALYSKISDGMGKRSMLPSVHNIERNVKACMILYVLTKLCLSFVLGASMSSAESFAPETAPEPSFQAFLSVIFVLALVIWAFRFQWLYVPMIMGWHPFGFLRVFRGFAASLYLLGICLLCLMPFVLFMVLMNQFLGVVFGEVDLENPSILVQALSEAVYAVLDFFMTAIASVAIVYGVFSVYNGDQKKPSIF